MKLTLSNFQIHQKPTTLDIPENEITYVEGDSDTGKSSRLRAMRWLCENKPDGGSFVTFKQPRGTNSLVRLEEDGRVIERERGKSKNLYRMDGETFEAFGRSVPEPIAKFLALSPYAFQLQGEVPFLIGASPTDAAKILSDACGLGVIDTAVQFVRGKKAVAEAEIRKSEILLESAQARLAAATEQLPLADALEAAAKAGDDVEELTSNVGLLSDALDDEPEGEVVDVEAVRTVADTAHACEAERGTLTTMTMRLCGAIRNEPTGTVFDVAGSVRVADSARAKWSELEGLHAHAVALNRAIQTEPTGTLLDVSAAKSRAIEARILGDWISDVAASADRLHRAIQAEPQGEIIDTPPIRSVLARALSAFEEQAVLDKMARTMRAALQSEPQGGLMDTSELLKQRAQIKVCSQCGREL
jgi:energy-coupling factor transporter ATP-binding protein EcfA2